MPLTKINHATATSFLAVSEQTQRVFALLGSPGIGKSRCIHDYVAYRRAQIPDYGYIDSRLLYYDATDLKGFPSIDKESGTSVWLSPQGFPLQKNVDSGLIPEFGLWAFEEFNSATPTVSAACYQAMLDREINGEKIAPGWFIVALGNTRRDKGVVNRIPSPLVSRMWMCQLEVSNDEWIEWAFDADIDPSLIAYFKYRPNVLMSFNPDEWEQDTPYCCPRSAEILSDNIKVWRDLNGGKKPPLELVCGCIGEGAGTEFWAYMDIFSRLPDIERICSGDKAYIKKSNVPKEPSELYAVAVALAKKVTKKNYKHVDAYMQLMPTEYEISTTRDIISRDRSFTGTDTFIAHTKRHKEVYAA